MAGYDWIWSQYHELAERDVLKTFRAVQKLSQAVSKHLREAGAEDAPFEDPALQAGGWQPFLDTIRNSIREQINPPAALGSGHRSLADKISC